MPPVVILVAPFVEGLLQASLVSAAMLVRITSISVSLS